MSEGRGRISIDWEMAFPDGCGTQISIHQKMPGKILGHESGRKCFQNQGHFQMDAELK